ncbi:MAG: NADH:ubiquinone oxidoreductase [Chloroflexota bacterium]|nr:NADH:ubiquinone oxidoreductase [Chloroflexota bacterium]PLS78542.1 MAG: NADH:ubiquinone oxidoreductase [Chloroflexota bacterium]
MPRTVRVFHLCAGDCGACAAEVWAAVEGTPELAWAATPQAADVVVLTGSVPTTSRGALLATYTTLIQGRLPVVVVGRCAIDGYPFGKGGIAAQPNIEARRKVDGCPPIVDTVAEALLEAARQPRIIAT